MLEESDLAGFVPQEVDRRVPTRQEHEITRPVADDLIRDMDVTTLHIARLGDTQHSPEGTEIPLQQTHVPRAMRGAECSIGVRRHPRRYEPTAARDTDSTIKAICAHDPAGGVAPAAGRSRFGCVGVGAE